MELYSFEMILFVGIILLSGMTAGGVKIWLKRQQNILEQSIVENDSKQNQ